MSSVIPASKKVTIWTSILKSQKTSDDFGNLHVNDGEDGGKRIEIDTLHLVSRHLQGSDLGSAELRKQS